MRVGLVVLGSTSALGVLFAPIVNTVMISQHLRVKEYLKKDQIC